MSDGTRIVTIPRHNPVNAITMDTIARDAGLSNKAFRELLQQYGNVVMHGIPSLRGRTRSSS